MCVARSVVPTLRPEVRLGAFFLMKIRAIVAWKGEMPGTGSPTTLVNRIAGPVARGGGK